MSNKLLDTKALTYLKPRITHQLIDIRQDELTGWTSGGAIRDSAGVERISYFVAAGRNGDSSNSNLGIDISYTPLLAWGGGDATVLLAVRYNFDIYAEAGISIVAGTNSDGSIVKSYLAKTDWVKTYLENQKTTTQDIENLFS